MPYRIKSRLADLGKSQRDLLSKFEDRDFKIAECELSIAIKEKNQRTKMKRILNVADEIVSEWEQDTKINENGLTTDKQANT